MSAWSGEPSHFANWYAASGGGPRDFAKRCTYGRYLGEILDDAVASGETQIVSACATAAQRMADGWRLGLEDGSTIEASALVLAIGNQEPALLDAFAGVRTRVIRNPWGVEARGAVEELAATGDDVLLVGTGLTMIDVVLSLDAAGHQGKIVAISRRGLVPRSHTDFNPAPVTAGKLPSRLGPLLRWLRTRSAEVGWRAAVDSLRPHSQRLWQQFSSEEQRRFLRHARPWWDVHRHRIAAEVATTIARLVGEGRLEIVAGQVASARTTEWGVEVQYRRRGSAKGQTAPFAYAFNCTGPLHSMTKSEDPLLRDLLDGGLVQPDELDIGLDIDAHWRAAERMWAIGPLTKGRYWEITAVPDIREQAAAIADDIERELKS